MKPWRSIGSICFLACLMLAPALAAAHSLEGVRLWPSPDYTRLTLESNAQIDFKYFTLSSPDRLVIDLTGVEAGINLASLPGLVQPDDNFVRTVRVGLNRPGVTRVVIELKSPVQPSILELKPTGDSGYRLVVDMHPASGDTGQVVASSAASAPASQNDGDAQSSENDKYTRLLTIVIDPGHGGKDPGAHGRHAYEKNVTLAIARKVKAIIDSQKNMRAVLTRNGDYFIPLADRVKKARALKADLFVSIHADSFMNHDASGSSVFALSEHGATSAAARWLARKENNADLIGGANIDVNDMDLKRTLIDLSQTATISDSLKLGRSVLHQLGEVNDLHAGHVEQAGFAVLKAPDIPSILVETDFISNPKEERRLTDQAYQEKIANAIVDGIKSYLDKNPPALRTHQVKDM
jgi:N-acetylmuramoyl-L-alanine amidase